MREFEAASLALHENPLPRSAHWLIFAVIAAIFTAIAWAALGEIDRVVMAPGKAISTGQRIVINTLVNSQIADLPVSIGQVVKRGDVLVRLDPTFAQADFAQLSERAEGLNAQYTRLVAEAQGLPYAGGAGEARLQAEVFRERMAQHQSALAAHGQEIGKFQSMLSTNREQTAGLRESHRVLLELEEMRTKLSQGQFMSRNDLLEMKRRRLEVESEMKRLASQEKELLNQLSKAEAERTTYAKDRSRRIAEEIVAAKREIDTVQEQLKKAKQQQEFVVMRAPEAAVVLEVAARSRGSVAKEAEPIVTLMPLGAPLEAEVEIMASDIGFVRAGMPVRIKVDAFPFQRHGTLAGVLRVVTEDAFQKDDRLSAGGLVYRARVSIESPQLRHVPENFRLIPGMSLMGEIQVGKRSVLSYVLYPLMQTMDEGLREP